VSTSTQMLNTQTRPCLAANASWHRTIRCARRLLAGGKRKACHQMHVRQHLARVRCVGRPKHAAARGRRGAAHACRPRRRGDRYPSHFARGPASAKAGGPKLCNGTLRLPAGASLRFAADNATLNNLSAVGAPAVSQLQQQCCVGVAPRGSLIRGSDRLFPARQRRAGEVLDKVRIDF
jgi:hypothetical protein